MVYFTEAGIILFQKSRGHLLYKAPCV